MHAGPARPCTWFGDYFDNPDSGRLGGGDVSADGMGDWDSHLVGPSHCETSATGPDAMVASLASAYDYQSCHFWFGPPASLQSSSRYPGG